MTSPGSGPAAGRRPGRTRVPAHVALTTGVVLGVCALLTGLTLPGFLTASDRIGSAGARTFGVVTAVDGDTVQLTWTPDGGIARTDPVRVAGPPPPPGTRTEVAYGPAGPLIPGSAVLADADRALTTLALVAVVAVLVPVVAVAHLIRMRPTGPAREVAVRRVKVRSGLLARSWLEVGDRWYPVHFDPALLTLPSPATVRLYRSGAAEWDGHVVLPSGRARSTEPRGQRTDNPTAPDAATAARARALAPLPRRLVADLPLVAGAPLVALLWAVVDGSGLATWLGTTALLAALALFWAALRGSDPS